MASIADKLKDLKADQNKLAKEQTEAKDKLADATRALDATQSELEHVTAKRQAVDAEVVATEKQEREVLAATSALTDVGTRIDDESPKLTADCEKLRSRVDRELAQARRTSLQTGLDKVDGAIDAATQAAGKAGEKLTAADAKLAKARAAAAVAERAYADELQRLQAVPKDIEALRAKVISVRDAATKAVDAGRMAEAFINAIELAAALKNLTAARAASSKEDPAVQLPQLWEAKLSTSQKLAEVTAQVGTLQAEAAEARRIRDALVANRNRDIAKMLSAPPAEPPKDEDAADAPAQPKPVASPAGEGNEVKPSGSAG